ncbi:MAG: hypothetical protein EB060_03625 [Proteobacteria bacterium]|nr:hypothetical protein [Pseudomonadota bacterium]
MSDTKPSMRQILERTKSRAATREKEHVDIYLKQQVDLQVIRESLMKAIHVAEHPEQTEQATIILSKLVPIVLKVIALERSFHVTIDKPAQEDDINDTDKRILAQYVERYGGANAAKTPQNT